MQSGFLQSKTDEDLEREIAVARRMQEVPLNLGSREGAGGASLPTNAAWRA